VLHIFSPAQSRQMKQIKTTYCC